MALWSSQVKITIVLSKRELVINFVQVAIPVPMRQLFTYIIPETIQIDVLEPGHRVLVPFGHRQVIGVVIKISATCEFDEQKLKPIVTVINDNYPFPASLLSFLQRCANYYHHPIGDVLQQALPVPLRQIEQPDLSFVKHWFSNNESDNTIGKSAVKQQALFDLIKKHKGISWPELRTLNFTKAQLNALEKKQLVYEKEVIPQVFQWQHDSINEDDKLSLSVEQSIIISALSLKQHEFSCHLIEGVTGSGKTEVYLQAMEPVLAESKQVLVLVPEIGLTPQTLSRFEQRFNVPVFLHHSGLNDKERLDTWLAAYKGHAGIIIGTRSAVFTPAEQLGLIIIDEEHDGSLKQQDSFRYNARDIAILRARQLNIPIVLGSATPSLETLQNALSGKYHYHQLTKRAGKSQQATFKLVDVNQQQMEFGLSGTVKKAIEQTLARDEQVLIFLNRRGFAPAINCQECHWVAECSRCNKPYTLHHGSQLLVCHHCASQKRLAPQCNNCGSVRLKPIGIGTEQLEQHLANWFPDHDTVRIDRDSTRRKGELAKRLQDISDKKHHILVGTQMLAKGHHFPDVTLVCILDVDGALFSYDFRAAEHMAQLLIQVAGRAGRASKPGTVHIQTQYPEHPLLQDLIHNGYHHFAKQALSERRMANLPPFGYQALIRAEANYPSYPEKFLRALSSLTITGCEMAGPMPAAMEKKAGKYRYHLILQAKDRKQLHIAIVSVLNMIPEQELNTKVRWSLDIDPLDFSW